MRKPGGTFEVAQRSRSQPNCSLESRGAFKNRPGPSPAPDHCVNVSREGIQVWFCFKSSPDVLMPCPVGGPLNSSFGEEENEEVTSPRSHSQDPLLCPQLPAGSSSCQDTRSPPAVLMTRRPTESLLRMVAVFFFFTSLSACVPRLL